VFLSVIFVRRLFLILTENKMQTKLKRELDLDMRRQKASQPDVIAQMAAAAPAESKKACKSGNVRSLFKKGEMKFAKNDLEEAERCFVQIVSLEDTHLEANLYLGLIYLKQKNFPKAEFFFHKLVNLKKDPVYYSNLGLALYQQGRLLEAAEAYESAVVLDDKRAARFASLAQVYRELSNDEKALINFERASQKSPRNLDYLWATLEYYQKLSRADDVAATADRILDLDPYNEDAKRIRDGNKA